jgi:PAS domain S-box-containing protein
MLRTKNLKQSCCARLAEIFAKCTTLQLISDIYLKSRIILLYYFFFLRKRLEERLKLDQRQILPTELEIQIPTIKVNSESGHVERLIERKKTVKALRNSEEKYRLLFTNMINGYAYCKMLFDKDGKPVDFVYLEVNDAFEKLTGIKKEIVIGKKVTQALPGIEKANPELFEIYGKVARTGINHKFEVYFKLLNLWLSIAVYRPKKKHFVAVFENITEQKQLNQRLEEYSEGLEFTVAERTKELLEAQERLLKTERLAAIGELAGMVGHDLRNPLAGIKNATYFLRKKQASFIDDSGREMLSIIDKAVEHADNIVNDLLDYSREMHLELEEFSPKSLMDYVLLMVKIPSQVKITQNIQSSPLIWVDANKIQRVFVNLVKNAIEAMPNGGALEISSRQNGENIDFSFDDTGTGMSDDVIIRIFTPLFTTKAQGMGLGLVICKRIIETHGGKIKVESALNKGTKFTLSLPMKPRNEE